MNEEKLNKENSCVYGHYTSDTNELFYIGVASRARRLTCQRFRNRYWINVFNKHGFYYQILFKSSFEECLKKEIELIALHGRRDLGTGSLVNLTDGGEGVINISAESRAILSEKTKNRVRKKESALKTAKGLTGRKASLETRMKMSVAQKKKGYAPFTGSGI